MESPLIATPTPQDIELAAYYLWLERGSPFGSPEVDWFRAQEHLGEHTKEAPQTSAVASVAKAMGAALGSIAGFVESLSK